MKSRRNNWVMLYYVVMIVMLLLGAYGRWRQPDGELWRAPVSLGFAVYFCYLLREHRRRPPHV